jgi:hypothetical protein
VIGFGVDPAVFPGWEGIHHLVRRRGRCRSPFLRHLAVAPQEVDGVADHRQLDAASDDRPQRHLPLALRGEEGALVDSGLLVPRDVRAQLCFPGPQRRADITGVPLQQVPLGNRNITARWWGHAWRLVVAALLGTPVWFSTAALVPVLVEIRLRGSAWTFMRQTGTR